MYNVEIDSNGYFTGIYASVGKIKNGIDIDVLPDTNDNIKMLSYHIKNKTVEVTKDVEVLKYYYYDLNFEKIYISKDDLSNYQYYNTEITLDDNGNTIYETIKETNIILCWEFDDTRYAELLSSNLKNVMANKQSQLGEICTNIITNGFDVVLSDNLTHHFSLETKDQTAIMMLYQQASTDPNAITFWHADGEICRQFSNEDMITIGKYTIYFKTYNETLINHLNRYIETLTNINDINDVLYSVDSLSDEYKNSFANILNALK